MRHIVHTCLLALRLISSVDLENLRTKSLLIFENSFLNDAFTCVLMDFSAFEKKQPVRAYKLASTAC